MRFDSVGFAAGLALLASAAPLAAQEFSSVPDHLLGMVGDWRLEQEDQSLATCALTFTEDAAPGGWALVLPAACPAPFPPASAMAAWTVDDTDGSVIILDAAGGETLRILEDEDGLFITATRPPLYLMMPYDAEGTGGEAGDDL